ncbi:MAG: hypothetical protein M1820_002533 [Bogoriella megaspora]|nr:MAG: hypothetical protein M1820_002533 [Bogoriella megaspora]
MLESAISFIKRIRKAHKLSREQKELFMKLEEDASSIREVIKIIKEERELQTNSIRNMLTKLEATESNLIEWLEKTHPGEKGPIRQIAHQLVYGTKEQKALAGIRNELSCAKTDLCMSLQVAHVGLTRSVGDETLANRRLIRHIDRRLRETIGSGGGLKIAQLLKDRPSRDDGSVELSDADIASLDSEDGNSTDSSEPLVNITPGSSRNATPKPSRTSTARSSRSTTLISPTPAPPKTSRTSTVKLSAAASARPLPTSTARSPPVRQRINRKNTTGKGALMINAPIGDDLWSDMDIVVNEENTAHEDSKMFNYKISREDFYTISGIPRNR